MYKSATTIEENNASKKEAKNMENKRYHRNHHEAWLGAVCYESRNTLCCLQKLLHEIIQLHIFIVYPVPVSCGNSSFTSYFFFLFFNSYLIDSNNCKSIDVAFCEPRYLIYTQECGTFEYQKENTYKIVISARNCVRCKCRREVPALRSSQTNICR